jgi:hypothetical protein
MAEPVSELPVVVFAYNRPRLLERTLSCLRDSGARSLYLFSDGPRGAADEPLVEEVRRLARGVSWGDCTLVEREHNLGGSRSTVDGMALVFGRHGRAVVIEDDICVAPEFLRFAHAALERYADEPRIAGVTGLRMPFSRRPLRGYQYDAFLLPRFFTWSWATWRRAWETFELDHEKLLGRLRESRVRLELGGADLPYMVRSGLILGTLAEPWDVCCSASMVLNGQFFVVPTWNMVENIGMDSGVHPHGVPWTLRWEEEHRPDLERLLLPPPEVDRRILKSYRVFRENPRGWTARRLVPRPARMLLRRVRGTYRVLE